jgi:hypothetical protein
MYVVNYTYEEEPTPCMDPSICERDGKSKETANKPRDLTKGIEQCDSQSELLWAEEEREVVYDTWVCVIRHS